MKMCDEWDSKTNLVGRRDLLGCEAALTSTSGMTRLVVGDAGDVGSVTRPSTREDEGAECTEIKRKCRLTRKTIVRCVCAIGPDMPAGTRGHLSGSGKGCEHLGEGQSCAAGDR